MTRVFVKLVQIGLDVFEIVANPIVAFDQFRTGVISSTPYHEIGEHLSTICDPVHDGTYQSPTGLEIFFGVGSIYVQFNCQFDIPFSAA